MLKSIYLQLIFIHLTIGGINKNTISDKPASCGRPKIEPTFGENDRIIGGHDARPHSLPWQVSLQKLNGKHVCGGTLINEKFVLTASHCLTDHYAESLKIVAGIHDITKVEFTQIETKVKSVVQHPNYTYPQKYSNDLAIVELIAPINFTDFVSPLCLPETKTPTGRRCLVSGWGYTDMTVDRLADVLQQADVGILYDKSCQINYGKKFDNESMICAGYENGGVDTCWGDSGGPLACLNPWNNKWELVGVTSWGYFCALPHSPGVYSCVLSALPWINENIQY